MIVLEAENLKKTYLRDLPLYKQVLLPFSRRQRVKALDSVRICGQVLRKKVSVMRGLLHEPDDLKFNLFWERS